MNTNRQTTYQLSNGCSPIVSREKKLCTNSINRIEKNDVSTTFCKKITISFSHQHQAIS